MKRTAAIFPLAGLAGLVILACQTPNGVSEDEIPKNFLTAKLAVSNTLVVELESLSGQNSFTPLALQSDINASGGQYIVHPNNGSNQNNSSAEDGDPGQVTITFSLSQTANVQIDITANFPNPNDDSFYYKLDGGSWNTQNNVTTSGWESLPLTTFASLSPGTHNLRILRREDGAKMDNVTLTASAGTITEGGGGAPSTLEVEMESFSDRSGFLPFAVQSAAGASGGLFIVWPNNGSHQFNGSPSDGATGQVLIDFNLSQTANVRFDILADFPNGNDDSFYYKLDGGSWMTQNNATTSGFGSLTPATFSNLASGDHSLRILRREDGARMDKITLTASTGTISSPVVPPVEGYRRNPIVTHIYTADPSAKVFNGRIYVYTSHDEDDQTGYHMEDYHVYSSDDLVNWQDHGVALSKADVPWVSWLYAPDACYSPVTGKYYLYFPNSASNIGVAVSDNPAGPFEDALGGPLITKNIPGVEDVNWVFDPACFVDDDGEVYLYFGGGSQNTGDNARVIRLNSDMISLKDTSATTIAAPDFFEASFMHKRNGIYYFSYSTTFANHSPTIDYMMSTDPMSGFSFAGTAIPNGAANNYNNNHHSFVEYQGSWYAFHHNRVLSNLNGATSFQRSISFDHLSYGADNTMDLVAANQSTVKQLKPGNVRARWEAENRAAESGTEVDFAFQNGQRVGVKVIQIQSGDWIGYSQMDFGSAAINFQARVASGWSSAAEIELFLDGCQEFNGNPGTLIGSCQVSPTGGWNNWVDVNCPISSTSGIHDLCLQFTNNVDIDYFQFN